MSVVNLVRRGIQIDKLLRKVVNAGRANSPACRDQEAKLRIRSRSRKQGSSQDRARATRREMPIARLRVKAVSAGSKVSQAKEDLEPRLQTRRRSRERSKRSKDRAKVTHRVVEAGKRPRLVKSMLLNPAHRQMRAEDATPPARHAAERVS